MPKTIKGLEKKRAAALTKRSIRNTMLLRLKEQKEDVRNRKSTRIREKLFRTSLFKKAKIIMFYIALNGEVETREMIKEAQNLGKIAVVPVCKDRDLIACVLDDKAKLQKGPYGVWEPVNKKPFNLGLLDLVVVPGLAFDKKGCRLGRGKGYYDRFLTNIPKKTASIGTAFDFQIIPSVPTTPRDVNVQKIIFA